MNSKMVIAAFVAILGIWVMGPCMARMNDVDSSNGIVVLPGYAHAVGMCGKPTRADELLSVHTDGSIFQGMNYYVVINDGHSADNELQNLKALTLIECN